MESTFVFEPSAFVPFRDRAVCDRVRRIPRSELEKHPNPDFRIRILPERYFYRELDSTLRPPVSQIVGPTNANIDDYQKMIDDAGGCDVCYSGPGWTGHIAFIEPDAPEFAAESLDEWKRMGARVVTLSPFTIAQNVRRHYAWSSSIAEGSTWFLPWVSRMKQAATSEAAPRARHRRKMLS
jgi:hypothetical protein